MATSPQQTTQLFGLIERMRAGEVSCRDELIKQTAARLTRLTRKMLRGFPGVHRWMQTDDVFQSAVLRLWRALETVRPQSIDAFFGLAAEQIRRELIDLARHYFGPEGAGAHHASHKGDQTGAPTPECSASDTQDPSRLAEWTEFHEQAGQLPEKERQVFDLLYYQGLKQREAAVILQADVSTVQRRWVSALRKLRERLQGNLPGG